MSTQKALDKITEWLSIATQMQSYLPSGDRVLAYWFATLEGFKKDLPLLHKMASDALKVLSLFLSLWYGLRGWNAPAVNSTIF